MVIANKNEFTQLVRKQFPMMQARAHTKPLVYLDTAATSQKPYSVINTMTTFDKNNYATVHRALYQTASFATDGYEGVRQKVAHFINANDSEIVFTKGTTEAINLVASGFQKAILQPGDSVIISALEHHANIVPWQMACDASRAELKVIPITDDGDIDFEAFTQLLDSKTKIVALSHISNVIGRVNPIKKFIDKAHEIGAYVLIDGAQAASHSTLDMKALKCDFYAFSGHKMYGPTGIGVLFGKQELLEMLPPYQGGGDMIETVTFEKTTYAKPPLKFEAGTPPITQVIGLGAAIDFLQEIGFKEIQAHEKMLMSSLLDQLSTIKGLQILGSKKDRTSLVSFYIEGKHPMDITTLLDLKGIACRSGHLCAQPLLARFGLSQCMRISLAIHTSQDEIDFFTRSLKEVIDQV